MMDKDKLYARIIRDCTRAGVSIPYELEPLVPEDPRAADIAAARLKAIESIPHIKGMSFTIPIPPSVNEMYTQGRNGRRVPTSRLKAFKRDFALFVKPAELTLACEMMFALYLPPNIRGDTDNRIKAALDMFVTLGHIKNDTAKIVCGVLSTAKHKKEIPPGMARAQFYCAGVFSNAFRAILE